MPLYQIAHETIYRYRQPVAVSHHLAHLLPRPSRRQHWFNHRLDITPEPTANQERLDLFGNRALAFDLEDEHEEFRVLATGTVDVSADTVPDHSPAWEEVADRTFRPRDEADWEASACAYPSPLVYGGPAIRQYAAASFRPGRPLLTATVELIDRIAADFTYVRPAVIGRSRPMPSEILRLRRGDAVDLAHFAAACFRSHRLACRYLSGYLHNPATEHAPTLHGGDAPHAWIAVYLPDHGWVEFDPANRQPVDDRYIILAWGRDFGDVSPLKGVCSGGGDYEVSVNVTVSEMT